MILFGVKSKPSKESVVEQSPRIESISVSERGLVMPDNQDHLYVDALRGVFCVADGVGGGAEGAKASEFVCRNLKMYTAGTAGGFKATLSAVQKSLEESNAAIRAYAELKSYEIMASTAAVIVVDPMKARHVAVCHIGDTRVYRISHGMPQLLTRDHRNEVGDNRLLRAVGASETLKCDWVEIDGESASRYVICTDGVHDVVSAARIAIFTAAGALQDAAKRLSEDVVRHGAPDNYSFIIVQT